MFSLGVELLMRRAIMSRWDSREEAEWPPHPDRLFMALVAGFGETGKDPTEQAALEWLEVQGAPAIAVSEVASVRTSFISYVPVNDDSSPIEKGVQGKPDKPRPVMGTLGVGRLRQPRQFPAVVPDSPTFHLMWNVDLPANLRPALEAVCRKAMYLGHSATPVRVWIEDGEVTPNLVPVEGTAKHRLRVFGKGRLEYLLSRFAAGLRPLPSLWQGYSPPRPSQSTEPAVPFDPGLIVLRQIGGRKFSLESSGMIADTLRDTLMKRHGPNAPEWLAGHGRDNAPTKIERPAIMPLGFVGSEHADGHLLGIAVAVPREFERAHATLLFDLLQRPDERDRRSHYDLPADHPFVSLHFKNSTDQQSAGEFAAELDERPDSARRNTLRPDTWTAPARLWVTATPLILPQFPRRGLTPEEVVSRACRDAGYPEPAEVRTSYAPALAGVPHSRSFFVRSRRNGRPPRPLIHAVIQFAEPIRGPVLLGAGRYNGFGICRPLSEDNMP